MFLPDVLLEEKGMYDNGVAVCRPGGYGFLHQGTVEEFLSRPENQSGKWMIDGGWGYSLGPVKVAFESGHWVNKGFPPWD